MTDDDWVATAKARLADADFVRVAPGDMRRALAVIEAADRVAAHFEALLAQVHRCEGYCPLHDALAAYRKARG